LRGLLISVTLIHGTAVWWQQVYASKKEAGQKTATAGAFRTTENLEFRILQ